MLSGWPLFLSLILYWHRLYCSPFIDEKVSLAGMNNLSKGTCQLEHALILLCWLLQSPFSLRLALCPEDWPLPLGSLAYRPPVVVANQAIYSSLPNPPHAQLAPSWVTISAASHSLCCRSFNAPSFCPFRSRAGTSFSLLLVTKTSLITLESGCFIPSSQLGLDSGLVFLFALPNFSAMSIYRESPTSIWYLIKFLTLHLPPGDIWSP